MSGPLLLPPVFAASNWTDVSVQDALRAYAAVGVPAGLAAGLLLGLAARREDGWGGYASFPRRCVRLAHIAAVMLPAIAGLYSLLLQGPSADAAAALWGTRLWIAGGLLLPLSLAAAAFRPRLVFLVPPPALACTAASVCFAWALLGGIT